MSELGGGRGGTKERPKRRSRQEYAFGRRREKGERTKKKIEYIARRLKKTQHPLAPFVVEMLEKCQRFVYSHPNPYNFDEQKKLATFSAVLYENFQEEGGKREQEQKSFEVKRVTNQRDSRHFFLLFTSREKLRNSEMALEELEKVRIREPYSHLILNFFEKARGPALMIFNHRDGDLLTAEFNPKNQVLTLRCPLDYENQGNEREDQVRIKIKNLLPDQSILDFVENLITAQVFFGRE